MCVVQAGQEAQMCMMKSNEQMVVNLARRYMYRGLEFQDLLAEGMSGLWRGVKKFDARRGLRLSTYAWGEVHRAIMLAIDEQVAQFFRR